MPDPQPNRRVGWPVGLAMVGSEIVGFAVVGILIDYATGALGNVPWATLILAPLGLVAALYHLTKLAGRPPA